MNYKDTLLKVSRYCMGFIFLWAFVDKLFGLGFATTAEKAWINGGSPTFGFLGNAKGIFSDFFVSLSNYSSITDILFMAGLLGIGLAFLLNKKIKLASICATIMLGLMYLALMIPANNPIIDDHIMYILLIWIIYHTDPKLSK